jgi:phage shock protein PspC (stress-responsive transcriptional regulator)
MQKVITINLNGNAYQVDEGGYAALLTYLDTAQRQLLENPDRAEIIADLEQAIADKCRAFLSPHKTVVTSQEVDQIIREMGPVDGSAGATAAPGAANAGGAAGSSTSSQQTTPPRRLYTIREGAMLAGVCTGLAAYFHLDVTIVRIIFVVLALLTRGGFALAYLVLAIVIPPADTSEQRAEAHGERFNAQELIDQAKKQYASFTGSSGWGWRRQQRAVRRAQRRAARWSRWGWTGAWTPAPPAAAGTYGARLATGMVIPFLSLASMLLFAAWAFAVYSLITSGQVLGEALPDDVPYWVGIVVLVFLYHLVAWPLHFARRRAAFYAVGGYHYAMLTAWDTLLTLSFGIFVVWVAYRYVPEIREVIRAIPDVLRSFGVDLRG